MLTSLFTFALLSLSLFPSYSTAHGVVAIVTIDGTTYKQNLPGARPASAATRQITTVDPVKGANNPDILCGPTQNHNTQFATQSLHANPGSTVEFDWRGGDMSFWPHNTGPMLTYMANCGDGGCEKFDATKAKWFKIQQVARKESGNKDWAQEDLMSGKTALITLPQNIAPGNYLIRHEIIALHLATSRGGAEFYPSCTQLVVGGNGNGKPKDNELVSFPGAYSDDDPGIFFPGTFDPNAKYTYPGPTVASFVTSPASSSPSNDGGNSNSSGSPSSSSAAPSSTPSSNNNPNSHTPSTSSSTSTSSTGGGKTCHLKRRSTTGSTTSTNAAVLVARSRPRHFSRVMRSLRGMGIGMGVNFNAAKGGATRH